LSSSTVLLAALHGQADHMFELWKKMDLVNFGLMQEENAEARPAEGWPWQIIFFVCEGRGL
jgi:hypothetical protein